MLFFKSSILFPFLFLALTSCSHNSYDGKIETLSTGQDVAVITGTASGLGKSVAIELLKLGYAVYGGDIDVEGNKYLKELGGTPFYLDVRNSSMVTKKVNEIIQKSGKIDVLINNAGYAEYGPVEVIDIEDVINQFDVNVFGYARMQKAVLPHMRERKSGKIINVSSAVGKFSYPMLGWYAASKHAVEGMTDALKMEVASLNIKVVKILPGAFKSKLNPKSISKLDQRDIPDDYKTGVKRFKATIKGMNEAMPSAKEVANVVIKAVQSKSPKSEYFVLDDANYFIKKRRELTNDQFYKKISP